MEWLEKRQLLSGQTTCSAAEEAPLSADSFEESTIAVENHRMLSMVHSCVKSPIGGASMILGMSSLIFLFKDEINAATMPYFTEGVYALGVSLWGAFVMHNYDSLWEPPHKNHTPVETRPALIPCGCKVVSYSGIAVMLGYMTAVLGGSIAYNPFLEGANDEAYTHPIGKPIMYAGLTMLAGGISVLTHHLLTGPHQELTENLKNAASLHNEL